MPAGVNTGTARTTAEFLELYADYKAPHTSNRQLIRDLVQTLDIQRIGLRNVMDAPYNAKGDGVADDGPAFALAAADGPVYAPQPSVGYRMATSALIPTNRKILGRGSKIIAVEGTTPFTTNGDDVDYEGLVFDQSAHLTDTPGDDAAQSAIYSNGKNRTRVHKCILMGGTDTAHRAGRYGISIRGGDGHEISNCRAQYFTVWGIICFGAANYSIVDNWSIGHAFDGIKAGGVDVPAAITEHRRVIVSRNHCYDNAGDGIDMAMNLAFGVEVEGNNCWNNTLHGCDLKGVYQTGDIKVVLVRGNTFFENVQGQLHMQGQIGNRAIRNAMIVQNLLYTTLLTGDTCQLVEVGGVFAGNSLYGGLYGLRNTARLTDAVRLAADGSIGSVSPQLLAKGNLFRDGVVGVLYESQGGGQLSNFDVIDNDIYTVNSNLYRFKHIDDALVAGRVGGTIFGNRGIAGNNQFTWSDLSTGAVSLPQAGTIDVTYGDQQLGFTVAKPVATRGEPGSYYKVAQPQEGGYARYDAVDRNGAATWRGAQFTARGKNEISGSRGDNNVVLALGDAENQRFGTNLTVDRDLTLPVIGAGTSYPGMHFRVFRRGGAFNLNVRDSAAVLIKAIPANSWGDFTVNDANTAWLTTGFGAGIP
jgi:hypothetical protein